MKIFILAFLFGCVFMLEQRGFGWPAASDDGPPNGANCNTNTQGLQCGVKMVGGHAHCFSCPAATICWAIATGWDCVGNCSGSNQIQCGVDNSGNPLCCTAPDHCNANTPSASLSCGTSTGNGPACTPGPNCRISCAVPFYFCGNPGKPLVDNVCCSASEACALTLPLATGQKYFCAPNKNLIGQPGVKCGAGTLMAGTKCCISGSNNWPCPSTLSCGTSVGLCGTMTKPFPPNGTLCSSVSATGIVWTCPVGKFCSGTLGQCLNAAPAKQTVNPSIIVPSVPPRNPLSNIPPPI